MLLLKESSFSLANHWLPPNFTFRALMASMAFSNHVKIIIINILHLIISLFPAIFLGCRKFCDYRLTFQFLPQCIVDMFCYCLVISTIKLSYLLSIKPHGIFLQLHFKLGIAIFRSKEYDGLAVIRNNSILFHTSSSLLYLFHILFIFHAISLRSQSGSSISTSSPFHNISCWKSKVGRRGQHCPSICG